MVQVILHGEVEEPAGVLQQEEDLVNLCPCSRFVHLLEVRLLEQVRLVFEIPEDYEMLREDLGRRSHGWHEDLLAAQSILDHAELLPDSPVL